MSVTLTCVISLDCWLFNCQVFPFIVSCCRCVWKILTLKRFDTGFSLTNAIITAVTSGELEGPCATATLIKHLIIAPSCTYSRVELDAILYSIDECFSTEWDSIEKLIWSKKCLVQGNYQASTAPNLQPSGNPFTPRWIYYITEGGNRFHHVYPSTPHPWTPWLQWKQFDYFHN